MEKLKIEEHSSVVTSIQGEIRGLEWLGNQLKFFENKIKNNKQSPKT
jgi:hypothetical protein